MLQQVLSGCTGCCAIFTLVCKYVEDELADHHAAQLFWLYQMDTGAVMSVIAFPAFSEMYWIKRLFVANVSWHDTAFPAIKGIPDCLSLYKKKHPNKKTVLQGNSTELAYDVCIYGHICTCHMHTHTPPQGFYFIFIRLIKIHELKLDSSGTNTCLEAFWWEKVFFLISLYKPYFFLEFSESFLQYTTGHDHVC